MQGTIVASSVGVGSSVRTRTENRQADRRPVHGPVVVTVTGYSASLTLIDVSVGGFAITSSEPFGDRPVREFRFTDLPGQIVVQARMIHCAKLFPERFLSGWAFLPDTSAERILKLIAATT